MQHLARTRIRILPLGEDGCIVHTADETSAVELTNRILGLKPSGLRSVYPAYASVGVLFDPEILCFDQLSVMLMELPEIVTQEVGSFRLHKIPVCYEMQQDMRRVMEHTQATEAEIITLHTSQAWQVHAIGFIPGFPYLGYLPEAITGVPRLASPRIRVEPGSVGITGRQTGIYPLARPGGWNLIGRTPLTIVDVTEHYFPIRVGDRVQFERIDEKTYSEYHGERL